MKQPTLSKLFYDILEVTDPFSGFLTTIALTIPTTLSFQSSFILSPPKTTPQPEGEQVKDKGNKAFSHEEVVKEECESESDAKIRVSGSLVESSKHKPLKKIIYINEKDETLQMTKEEIKNQKGIE
ncbi:hypothetical protein Tco_1197091 [Tanacetum coccineum]